jgi:hypothetical protein
MPLRRFSKHAAAQPGRWAKAVSSLARQLLGGTGSNTASGGVHFLIPKRHVVSGTVVALAANSALVF